MFTRFLTPVSLMPVFSAMSFTATPRSSIICTPPTWSAMVRSLRWMFSASMVAIWSAMLISSMEQGSSSMPTVAEAAKRLWPIRMRYMPGLSGCGTTVRF